MHRIAALLMIILGVPATAQETGYLQLIDRLDRPMDGYCLDILGWSPATYRTDLPVNAHNCKPGVAPDGLVELSARGAIRFVAFDLCLTAHGVGGRSLPGAPLMLAGCRADAPAQRVAGLQSFEKVSGQLRFVGSDLCLAAGDVSDRTFSAADRWRMLTLERCSIVPRPLSEWQVIDPRG